MKLIQVQNYTSFLQHKEVPLHQQVIASKRLATQYGDVGIGVSSSDCTALKNDPNSKMQTQVFKMLFDTGSCEFWIPNQGCKTYRCSTHNRYKDSCTFKRYQDAMMKIQQLSGEVSGKMGKETVILGDLVVPNQIIGVADRVDVPLLDEVTWDGILGLAYPNKNLRSQKIDPLVDNIIRQNILTNRGERNQFSYYLGPDMGSVIFGGVDLRQKRSAREEFVYAPITSEDYWTVKISDVRVLRSGEDDVANRRKRAPICPDGCKTIIDTGTYLIQGPEEQFRRVLRDVEVNSCDDRANLPSIVLEIIGLKDESGADQVVELVLTPDDYVLEFDMNGVTDCVMGLAADTEDTGWTLGQVFLKSFLTVFDREEGRIGFVRSNMNPFPLPGKSNHSSVNFKQLLRKQIYDSMKDE